MQYEPMDGFLPALALLICGCVQMTIPSDKSFFAKLVRLAGPVLALCLLPLTGGDRLSMLFGLAFSVAALLLAVYNWQPVSRGEAAAEMVYAGSALGTIYSQTWLSLLIFWELMAVSSWLVVVASRTKAASQAGFRYLLVHFFGGNLLLAGVILQWMKGSTTISCLTGLTDASFWLILLGVAVNTAIPPLNGWLADAYPESTIGGTVYLGTYTTKVGVYCLIRLFAGTEFLLYFGVGMAIYGACQALLENDMRRLFSYHIISQLGYMVAAAAVGGAFGVDGAAAHAVSNILYKGVLLMCAGAVICATGKSKINALSGLAKTMPLTAGCFLLASLAIAGFPPFNGFVSKALVMHAVEETGQSWAVLLLLVASVGTLLSITLKVNWFVFFGPVAGNDRPDVEIHPEKVRLPMKIAMVSGVVLCLLMGIFPQLTTALVPFGADVHPYTVSHVAEYLELFAGGTLTFILYRQHMKPKDKLMLDTDWFYRKPLKIAIKWVSYGCWTFLQAAGKQMRRFVTAGSRFLHDPAQYFGENVAKRRQRRKQACLEDDDVLQNPIDLLVAVNFMLLLIVGLLVFCLTRAV